MVDSIVKKNYTSPYLIVVRKGKRDIAVWIFWIGVRYRNIGAYAFVISFLSNGLIPQK